MTRVAWTGDGNRPLGDTVDADAFEVGFDEWMDEASVAGVTANLTEDGGSTIDLVVTLDPGGRGVTLMGASVTAGTGYTLHLGGVEDRAGNEMPALDLAVNVADPAVYEVVSDDAGPVLLAAVDAVDGIVLVFDEPVTAADLGGAVTVERSGVSVDGTTARISAGVVKWTADDPLSWMVAGDYSVTGFDLVDTATSGNSASSAALPVAFRHLATDVESPLVVFEADGDSVLRGESEYGVTGLFQGRGWHGELGLYYYRWRWYAPGMGGFLERDPLGYVDGQSLTMPLRHSPPNYYDPLGLQIGSWDSNPGIFSWSEPLRSSHNFLVNEMLAQPNLGWYFREAGGKTNGYVTIDVAPNPTLHSRDYDNAIVGGDKWPQRISRSEDETWFLDLGKPPYQNAKIGTRSKVFNIMWQRMRLFQLERAIDFMLEMKRRQPQYTDRERAALYHMPGLEVGPTPEKLDVNRRYRRAHWQASMELLVFLPKFTKANQYFGSASDHVEVFSALLSAIVENSPLPVNDAQAEAERIFKWRYQTQFGVVRPIDRPFPWISPKPPYQYPWTIW